MRTVLICLMLLAAPVERAFADKLADIRAATDARLLQADGSMRCFPDVKGPSEIYVFNQLGNGELVSTAIKTGWPVRYSDIVVETTDQPVLLALYNYSETVWRVQLKPGGRLAGVVINGYERASVVGLPDDTPIGRNYDFETANTPAPRCGLKAGELDRPNWEFEREVLKRRAEGALAQADAAARASQAARETYDQTLDRSADADVWQGAVALLEAMEADAGRLYEAANTARAAFETFDQARPAWPPEEDPHLTSVHHAMDLWGAENRLKKYGPWRVVYAEVPDVQLPVAYVVSAAKARAFQAAKVKARAELDAFPGPALPPLRPANGARLEIPKGTPEEDALVMMVAAGYAVKNGPAQKYLNDAMHLQKAAVGLPHYNRSAWLNAGMDITKPDPVLTPTDVYTLLGPVVVQGCVVSSVLFYLPEGVPDPVGGERCRSRYVRERSLRLRDY